MRKSSYEHGVSLDLVEFSRPASRKMSDWEDQELVNIIWGEAGDHIVPYTEESERRSQSVFVYHDKNEAHEETSNSKLCEQKPATTKTKLHRGKPESNDDLSFVASNPELNCIGKAIDLGKGCESSKDHNEDTELGDIINSSWAAIGNFDDLDQIFSNDVLVDHASLNSTDEFWTSSKDAMKSSSLALDSIRWGLEPIGNLSSQFDFDTDYLHNGSPSFANRFERPTDSTCYTQESLHSSFDERRTDGTTDPNLILEKTASGMAGKTISGAHTVAKKAVPTSKSSYIDKRLRSRSRHELKSDKINNDREPRDIYGTWLPPEINVQNFDSQSVPDKSKFYTSSVLGHENMPQQSTCLPYQNFPNPYLAAYSYGNLSDQRTSMSVLHETDDEDQPVLSNAEACLSERDSMDKSIDTSMKSQNMTPQEKIQKLRRRQQLSALLAIKKQQQQLSQPIAIADYSIPQKSSDEDQVLHLVRTDFEAEENSETIYDPNSPVKQDGSAAVSMEVVDRSVEDTVLDHLQDVVAKLEPKTRFCVRDSLLRLAQSAMQRNDAGDSSCANRHGGCEPDILKENISNQESFIKMPSAETDTNCIDRAVAHLLFKSTSKRTGSPVSSIAPKTPPGLKMGGSSTVSLSFATRSSENAHKISAHGQQEDFPEQAQTTNTSMNQKMKQKMVESAD